MPYEKMLENAPDAHILVAKDGGISYVNTQAERLFGYNRSEMIGRPVEMLIPERARGVHETHRRAFFRAPIRRPMGADIPALAGRRKDNSEFQAEVTLSPIGDGQVIAVVRQRQPDSRKATAQHHDRAVIVALSIHTAVILGILAFLLFGSVLIKAF